jgi:predicted CXXCH cytochrome family protein
VCPSDEQSADLGLSRISHLCISCHPGHEPAHAANGSWAKHPVGIPLASGSSATEDGPVQPLEIVEGSQDGPREVIACTTCHSIHDPAGPYLLRFREDTMVEFCTGCHAAGKPPTLCRN